MKQFESRLPEHALGAPVDTYSSLSIARFDLIHACPSEAPLTFQIPHEFIEGRSCYAGGCFVLPERALYEHGTQLCVPLNSVVFFQPDVALSTVLNKIRDPTTCTPAHVTPTYFERPDTEPLLTYLLMDGNHSLISRIILEGQALETVAVQVQDVHSLIDLCGSDEIDRLISSLNERGGRFPELRNDLR